ncbi:hypothetical protein ACFV5N_05210 [Streptomyces sp. NPDC059853]|uniref:hypothetical protein n=1 Tax=Streptomyces sp. NPDC059853 TaxID=3346973 RepID=UPI003646FC3E
MIVVLGVLVAGFAVTGCSGGGDDRCETEDVGSVAAPQRSSGGSGGGGRGGGRYRPGGSSTSGGGGGGSARQDCPDPTPRATPAPTLLPTVPAPAR